MKKYSSFKQYPNLKLSISQLSKQSSPTNKGKTPTSHQMKNNKNMYMEAEQFPKLLKNKHHQPFHPDLKTINKDIIQVDPINPYQLAPKSHRQLKNGMNSPKPQQGYSKLRDKINDLAGRLQEIKKDYQKNINGRKKKQKSSQKYKKDKENQIINIIKQDKKKNNQNKINQSKKQDKYQQENINQSKKDNKQKKSIIQEQVDKNNIQGNLLQEIVTQITTQSDQKQTQPLQQYVTTYHQQPPRQLTQCTSQINILKHSKNHKKYYINSIISAFASNKPSSFDQLCKNHIIASIQILQYMKSTNMVHKILNNEIIPKPLPQVKNRKHTIIFDLDETLIHCNQSLKVPYDIALPIKFPNNTIVKAGINIRPYAQQCLKQLSLNFELMIFTASHQCYANVIIDYLDPKKEYISHRFFRDSCYRTEQGFYIKDLRVIDRPLKNVLLIDNAAYSYGLQPENGVPIIPFYDNKADLQLKSLVSYLRQFFCQKDLRIKNSKIMQIEKYSQYKDAKILINQLYN